MHTTNTPDQTSTETPKQNTLKHISTRKQSTPKHTNNQPNTHTNTPTQNTINNTHTHKNSNTKYIQ